MRLLAGGRPLRLGASRAGFALRPHGLAKLVYEHGSGTILRVHLVTPTASDSIQFIVVAMPPLGVTVEDLARSIHVYPSFGEIVNTVGCLWQKTKRD